ncbi:MAG: hypothetical protein V9G24_19430 [Rhodoblastus sp.]|jgi:hypothetical protein
MTPRKDLAIDASCSVRELLTRQRQNGWMRLLLALIALAGAHASAGCAVVGAIGAVGSAGVGAVSTVGSVAASGASATLSGASALARATPRVDGSDKARAPEDQDKAD